MPKHGTALNRGQMAEFVGVGTKALILIADQLGPELAHVWAGKGELMQERFLKTLIEVGEVLTPKPQLLETIGTITIPATAGFIARDKFVVNTRDDVPVKIRWLGDDLKSWFLDKIEEPMPETTLRYAKLLKPSVDGLIRDEIGAEFEETRLSHIYALMARQPNGEKGALFTNGYANIFYAYDVNGVLRAVRVVWSDDGWDVHAYSVSRPFRWYGGRQVFSRNSS